MKSMEIKRSAAGAPPPTNDDESIISAAHVIHVTSSRFFGGPERQMLELARALRPCVATTFISFSEGNRCDAFLEKVRDDGFHGVELSSDTPYLVAAARELAQVLRQQRAALVCVHGYKAGLLGLWAGRRCGIPVVAVSRGWTGECVKVRLFERLDRLVLRRMDKVVCVSYGQADKVRRTGVADEKVVVIHNAVRCERFEVASNNERRLLHSLFKQRPKYIIGGAGRLSPEKGFDVLIEAAAFMAQDGTCDFGIVLFGDGALRDDLQRKINVNGLDSRFILAGFTAELDSYMPHFDAFVQSSHTEGLPNVLLEAAAAGVPVVATNVGGTAEVVVDGETGLLVHPGDANALAEGLKRLLCEPELRTSLRQAARRHVHKEFTFAAQASAYKQLFQSLLPSPERVA